MNFPLKAAPHIKGKRSQSYILGTVTNAAMFVAAWSIYNAFAVYGTETMVHVALIMLTACVTGTLTHVCFHMLFDALERKKFASLGARITAHTSKIKTGETIITGLILSLAMSPTSGIYMVVMTVIFAEVIGKLLFGGYGQNIFNAVAVGLVFNALTFGGSSLIVPLPFAPDMLTQATPLAGLNAYNWVMTSTEASQFLYTTGGIGRLFLGFVPGAIGEVSRFALLLALAYMIYKKVADWVVPAVYLGTVFVITLIYGFYIGAGVLYPVIHLLTGGLIFGAVFLATDPVTIPINRQGKVIFALLLAMFTLLIRFLSSHTEGVAFAILLTNMLVPFIDSKTANITSEDTNKKWMSIAITFAVVAVVVLGLTILLS